MVSDGYIEKGWLKNRPFDHESTPLAKGAHWSCTSSIHAVLAWIQSIELVYIWCIWCTIRPFRLPKTPVLPAFFSRWASSSGRNRTDWYSHYITWFTVLFSRFSKLSICNQVIIWITFISGVCMIWCKWCKCFWLISDFIREVLTFPIREHQDYIILLIFEV